MTRYYNQRRSLALVFYPRDQAFLDISDIKTTCLSLKLSHYFLRPFIVEYQVGPLAYCLKLPHTMKKLYPIFNIVKLSTALDDPIPEWRAEPLPLPIIVDGEKEQKVEKILDSCWHQRRFQFLVKQKGYEKKHNSWKVVSNVFVPDLVVEFYYKYPATPRYIHWTDFDAIFKSRTIALRCSNLEEG